MSDCIICTCLAVKRTPLCLEHALSFQASRNVSERAAIVAWLRRGTNESREVLLRDSDLADSIERGKHLKGET
jgi:hypothetical protein